MSSGVGCYCEPISHNKLLSNYTPNFVETITGVATLTLEVRLVKVQCKKVELVTLSEYSWRKDDGALTHINMCIQVVMNMSTTAGN